MKSTSKFGISLITICVILFLGSSAYAGAWTTVGSDCMVDEDHLSNYDAIGARLEHEIGRTGSVTARCNIVDVEEGENWNHWDITYRDPDGTGSNYRVRVWLYQVSQSSGGLTLLASFNSNSWTSTGVNKIFTRLPAHNFNFYSYAYYLYVEVYRANTSAYPAFIRAELRDY